jgi:hypothetical protein
VADRDLHRNSVDDAAVRVALALQPQLAELRAKVPAEKTRGPDRRHVQRSSLVGTKPDQPTAWRRRTLRNWAAL